MCVAGPLPWHTDFCALDVPAVDGDMDKLRRDHYLHKLVPHINHEDTERHKAHTQRRSQRRAFLSS